MGLFAHARLTRGLAVAMSLPVVITCASPTSDSRNGSDLAGVGEDPINASAIASIRVTLADSSIVLGDSTTAVAIARSHWGADFVGIKTTWSSENPAVASISSSGVVRGLKAGVANIVANTFGIIGKAPITVRDSAPPPPPPPAPRATQLGMRIQPIGGVTGAVLGTQPVVAVLDSNSNLVAGSSASVTASLASGDGILAGTTTVAAVNGVATFTNLTITGVGAFVLSFSSNGLASATSQAVSMSAGPPAQLGVVVQPSSAAASGAIFATQPVISVRDSYGNPVSRAGIQVTAQIASGGGTLGGTSTVSTGATGVATFTNLSITGSTGDRALSFSTPGLAGATSSIITVTAVPPPPPPSGSRTVIFASDWGTATGTSDAARRDLGKAIPWGGYGSRVAVTDVVSATGLNFPTANVMRVNGVYGSAGLETGQVTVTQLPYAGIGLGDLAPGQSNFYRLYIRVVWPANWPTAANNNHPIEETAGNGQNWGISLAVNASGWRPRLGARVSTRYALSVGGSEMNAIYLARDATYRMEWQVHRTSITEFQLHMRIYDAAGTLLYDDDDFVSGTTSLASTPTHLLNDPLTLRRFQVGTNGPGISNPGEVRPIWYVGGVAVCRGTWCGPYAAGERP